MEEDIPPKQEQISPDPTDSEPTSANQAPSNQRASGQNASEPIASPEDQTPPKTEQTRTFPCPDCGADLHYDAAKGVLLCGYCGREQPIETPERWAAEEHESFDTEQATRKWEGQRQISCDSCGGSWVVPATDAASVCPFCGRAHVSEVDADMLPPDAVLPFAVDAKGASERFKTWLHKRIMAPRALRAQAAAGNWRGVYYPYWTYDADTVTNYEADAGHYYYVTVERTRVVDGKTETYTEQERRTRWERTSGRVSRFFDDVLVRAVQLTEKAAAPEQFDLRALKPYLPEFLSGFLARRYDVGLREGYEQARRIMDRQIHSDIVRDVSADEVNVLAAHTDVLKSSFKQILLPLWGNRYTYRAKEYAVWVNGQTGKVSGKAPVSPWKVLLCVVAGLAVIALVVWLAPQVME
jgi:predicted RNA-binding Zn-ribbon protein involved in translation (DUF1610 family)